MPQHQHQRHLTAHIDAMWLPMKRCLITVVVPVLVQTHHCAAASNLPYMPGMPIGNCLQALSAVTAQSPAGSCSCMYARRSLRLARLAIGAHQLTNKHSVLVTYVHVHCAIRSEMLQALAISDVCSDAMSLAASIQKSYIYRAASACVSWCSHGYIHALAHKHRLSLLSSPAYTCHAWHMSLDPRREHWLQRLRSGISG